MNKSTTNPLAKYKLLFIFILLPLLVWLFAFIFLNNYIHQFRYPVSTKALFIILLISPTLEEIVFRGLFQDLFLQYIHKPWLSILLLNIGFALIHLRVNPSITYIILIFLSGLIFSCTKLYYTRLIFPIGLHIYYNLVFIVMLRIMLY